MPVHVTVALIEHLLSEAHVDSTREICGLLFGDADRIDAAERTLNVAADPARTFEIDPASLFRAIRAEREGGRRLIGHYHSHPNGSAEPSPRDLAAAEPGKYWLIIGGDCARLWLADRDGFREVKMIINQDRASTA